MSQSERLMAMAIPFASYCVDRQQKLNRAKDVFVRIAMNVEQIMNRDVKTGDPHESLNKAAQIMWDTRAASRELVCCRADDDLDSGQFAAVLGLAPFDPIGAVLLEFDELPAVRSVLT